MPSKTTRRSRSMMIQPVTFSSFARSVAQVTSSSMIKCQKFVELHGSLPSATGNGIVKNSLEDTNKQSESSEEEEKQFILVEVMATSSHFLAIHSMLLWDSMYYKCIMEIKEFLIKVCQDREIIDHLRLLLEEQAHDVGLLVSQRVFNLPPQLLPPLYDSLFDEVLWATEDEPTEELRKAFRFESFLIISKIYMHKNADQKKGESNHDEELIIYIKPEDEIFHKLCLWSFCFLLHSENVTTYELRNYRVMGLVMTVRADKVSNFREELHSLIDDS